MRKSRKVRARRGVERSEMVFAAAPHESPDNIVTEKRCQPRGSVRVRVVDVCGGLRVGVCRHVSAVERVHGAGVCGCGRCRGVDGARCGSVGARGIVTPGTLPQGCRAGSVHGRSLYRLGGHAY